MATQVLGSVLMTLGTVPVLGAIPRTRPMKTARSHQRMMRCLIACSAVVTCHTPAMADVILHNWSSAFNSSSGSTFGNTSAAGTITGSSPLGGFDAYPGTFGVPFAITSQNILTSEFQINGTTGLGQSVNFNFSQGYAWGTGGELILGNIHNYYEYTLSAWDFNNNPINVNSWYLLHPEFSSDAPGSSGYFSTSTTTQTPAGYSENFSVVNPNASGDGGQGGLLWLGGLTDVGRIELTLTSSSLGPNAQQVDFILFNVGTTAVPEPSSVILAAIAAVCAGTLGLLRGRRK